MASIRPTFDLTLIGNAYTSSKDDWYDLGALSSPAAHSPIPSGQQLWIGYVLVGSQDKALIYELRVNQAGLGVGTIAATRQLAYTASDPTSGSAISDLYQYGNIQTLAPVASATGLEKLWLRVQSGTNTVSSFTWFLYYSLYS